MARYLRIENVTRGKLIGARCRVAHSLRERTVGLLATPEPRPGDGLVIERTQSIHMFFMRYPIDVVFIDRDARVTRCVAGLRPWRVVWWARGARDCIELGVGSIADSGTAVGDQLSLAEVV